MQAPLEKLRSTLNLLRSMELSEVAHRMKERTRRRPVDLGRFDVGDGPLPKIPGLTPFDACGDTELLSRWRRVVEAAKAGRYRFLGQEWPGVTDAGKWHLDPTTGKAWPSALHCFDIAHRRERELGDIKYVWALNRLQFLQPIAALAGAEEDEQLAQLCAAELESWIDANPPFRGVNWASGFELGLRIASICVIAALIGDEAFTPEQRAKLRGSLAAHGFWLTRNSSAYSSTGNHLIAEAGGLFLLGSLAPDLPDAADYEAFGRRTLVDEAQKQIHDDGSGRSPSVTAFTVEWLLLCSYVAKMLGKPFPHSVRDRLLLAADHLRWMTDEGGNQPRIGDHDEPRVLYSQVEPEDSYISSVLGGLATMLERPALASPAPATPHLRNLIFGFARPSSTTLDGVRCFPAGGYTVMREVIAERRVLFVLDHGPLGHPSVAAHGHAGALALLLHVDDQPVLIDAGSSLRRPGGERRDRFRGTRAHSTLNIDGMDQSLAPSPFRSSRPAHHCLLTWKGDTGAWSVEAEHDGYLRRYGVSHRRQLARGADAFVTCTDWLVGPTQRPSTAVEIRYLVAPGLEVLCADGLKAQIRRSGYKICELSFAGGRDGKISLPIAIAPAEMSPRLGETLETVALVCLLPSPGMAADGIVTRIGFDCPLDTVVA
jgi:uncharacterized heparinase superfamily protein